MTDKIKPMSDDGLAHARRVSDAAIERGPCPGEIQTAMLIARLDVVEAERDNLKEELDCIGPLKVGTRERCKTHGEWFKPTRGCPWCKLDVLQAAIDYLHKVASWRDVLRQDEEVDSEVTHKAEEDVCCGIRSYQNLANLTKHDTPTGGTP